MIHTHMVIYPPAALAAATCVAATAACAVVVATTWPFMVVTGVRSVVAGFLGVFGVVAGAGAMVAAVTTNDAPVPVMAV